jgi:LuxR family maltose regulon positive regulatory protein
MPLFHRSFRDFSEYTLETDKAMNLFKKTMGVIVGDEFAVMKECILAGLLYEQGNLSKAHEHALAAMANIPQDCSPEIKFCGMMILAAVLHADEKNADADGILKNVEEMIEQNKAFYLSANLQAYLFRLKLAEGDKGAANEWLKDYGANPCDNPPFYKIYQHFTTARAYIVVGNYTNAALFLQKLLHLSERYGRALDVIEARILLAIVYWKKSGGQAPALSYLEQAAATANEYGYTQLFEENGAELITMLHRMQKRCVQKNYANSETSGAFIKTLYFAAIAGAKRSKGLTGGAVPDNMTFTEKQKQVMKLMCDGFSRNETAQIMGLKPYTVKSHIKLIYKKLNVSSNVEAVLKIKELDVLKKAAQ